MAKLFICAKEVQRLTGLSKTTSKLRLSEVRNHFGIPKYKSVTVAEYCAVNRLELQLVLEQLSENNKKTR